jgi:hypothetical protein
MGHYKVNNKLRFETLVYLKLREERLNSSGFSLPWHSVSPM